jgi:hypothetical protein
MAIGNVAIVEIAVLNKLPPPQYEPKKALKTSVFKAFLFLESRFVGF